MGNVQRFMQTLNTAYAMYFRYKHKRPGHCWQGRYGAQLVQGDDYILKLTRYIHLNPVKVKGWAGRPREEVLRHLNEWNWSSYAGYAGIGAPEGRVDYKWLELMGRATQGRGRKAYKKYLETRVSAKDEKFLEDDECDIMMLAPISGRLITMSRGASISGRRKMANGIPFGGDCRVIKDTICLGYRFWGIRMRPILR